MSSTFTLNFGLRWDVTQPWYETENKLETLIPGEQSLVFPGAPKGDGVVPGDPEFPPAWAGRATPISRPVSASPGAETRNSFLSRLLGGPGKTSIRAGAGIFFSAYEDAVSFNASGDAPYGYYWANPAPPLFTTPFIDRDTGFNEGAALPAPALPSGATLLRRIPIKPSTGRFSSRSPARRASGTKTIPPIRRPGTSPCSASLEAIPWPALPMWAPWATSS